MARNRNNDLASFLRGQGIRKRVARALSDLESSGRGRRDEAEKLARRVIADLRSAAEELEKRVGLTSVTTTTRRRAAKKGAATRKRAAKKRSASARKGVKKRASSARKATGARKATARKATGRKTARKSTARKTARKSTARKRRS